MRTGGNEKIFSSPWTGLGARMKVLLRVSYRPMPKPNEPPAAFSPLTPRVWSSTSFCCICPSFPLALAFGASLMIRAMSRNQTTWALPASSLAWIRVNDSLPASAVVPPFLVGGEVLDHVDSPPGEPAQM